MTDAEIAFERLSSWIQNYGASKSQVLIRDLTLILECARSVIYPRPTAPRDLDAEVIATYKAGHMERLQAFNQSAATHGAFILPSPEDQITDADVEAVEDEVGTGRGAWDMVNPKELIRACCKVMSTKTYPSSQACTCHERDSSYVCDYCYAQGRRGHMQRGEP